MDRNEILTLKVVDLREKLRELQLSTTGRKATLQDRLLEHFEYDILPGEETDEDKDFNSAADRNEQIGENEEPEYRNELNTTNRNSVSENLNSKNELRKVESQFTLRDIQDSMSYFNGSDHQEIETWIHEFNENANALLKGAAQKFIRSQNNILNWVDLKKTLIKEFGVHLSAADRHKLLKTRKKRPNESYVEFLYSIIELGKPLNLDDESVVEYFTDGIPDSRQNKTVLYEATSVEELKKKIKVYEKICNKSNENTNFKIQNYRKQCLHCPNLSNHNTHECRKANNLCFICGEKGHKARECPNRREDNRSLSRPQQTQYNRQNPQQTQYNRQNPQQTQYDRQNSQQYPQQHMKQNTQNREATNAINARLGRSAIRIFKDINIKNKTMEALIDTGSDICLISKSTFKRLQPLELVKEPADIIGIAQQVMKTLGHVEVKVEIDDIEFKWTFHVANDEDLILEAIIGNDVLKIIDMNLTASGSYFTYSKNCEHN